MPFNLWNFGSAKLRGMVEAANQRASWELFEDGTFQLLKIMIDSRNLKHCLLREVLMGRSGSSFEKDFQAVDSVGTLY